MNTHKDKGEAMTDKQKFKMLEDLENMVYDWDKEKCEDLKQILIDDLIASSWDIDLKDYGFSEKQALGISILLNGLRIGATPVIHNHYVSGGLDASQVRYIVKTTHR